MSSDILENLIKQITIRFLKIEKIHMPNTRTIIKETYFTGHNYLYSSSLGHFNQFSIKDKNLIIKPLDSIFNIFVYLPSGSIDQEFKIISTAARNLFDESKCDLDYLIKLDSSRYYPGLNQTIAKNYINPDYIDHYILMFFLKNCVESLESTLRNDLLRRIAANKTSIEIINFYQPYNIILEPEEISNIISIYHQSIID
jgi:hypothetical protein